jgi:disease resistance protein RPM1
MQRMKRTTVSTCSSTTFIIPTHIDVTGKIKSCIIHDLIHEFVNEMATDENFCKNKFLPELAHRLSVRNRVEQQEATQHSRACCWNICNPRNQSYQIEADESSATITFMEPLPSSAHVGLLEVLDLEDCIGLKDHHLKNICNHIFQL